MPPNVEGYQRYCPYTLAPEGNELWRAPDLARAQRLVRESGTRGQTVTVLMPDFLVGEGYDKAGRYVVSVLDRLGYRARYRRLTRAQTGKVIFRDRDLQVGFFGWSEDFGKPFGFYKEALTCGGGANVASFCDPAVDREMARAQSLESTDPEAAKRLWAKIDRELTNAAPWVAFATPERITVLADGVSNFQYHPWLEMLLDQLWVK
jgi:peptide/nickel transport system substrate-binding protein